MGTNTKRAYQHQRASYPSQKDRWTPENFILMPESQRQNSHGKYRARVQAFLHQAPLLLKDPVAKTGSHAEKEGGLLQARGPPRG